MEKPKFNIFWFRRDLRLKDNAGLWHALNSGLPVVPLFIYDKNILEQIPDKDDARVTFIYRAIQNIKQQLEKYNSSVLVKYNTPERAFIELLAEFEINEVFTNEDYEPYATERDLSVAKILTAHNVQLKLFKDHVVFAKNEIVKSDGKPYTVFTPYKNKWLELMDPDSHFKSFPSERFLENVFSHSPEQKYSLEDLGFEESKLEFPAYSYKPILTQYSDTRDFPALEGTSKIGVHLRFGRISIREVAKEAFLHSPVWLSELIWRDFYSMIMWHFPESANSCFKKEFENIKWRNNESEFAAWCEGKTGYPIVDAGMRQLNETGWMHNRVRMVTASFLCKHLLIDWRWGEAYFARKLIDYDRASNVGGWQWAAGTGNDAAPYFRIFNPELQTKRFDPKLEYVKHWVPEYGDPFKYANPIVEHKFARERALNAYKSASSKA